MLVEEHTQLTIEQLKETAIQVRLNIIDMIEEAQAGHPGGSLSATDIVTALYFRLMRIDPARPAWPDRDRFILSAGHGSMLIYALLYLTGYEDMTLDQIRNFRQ